MSYSMLPLCMLGLLHAARRRMRATGVKLLFLANWPWDVPAGSVRSFAPLDTSALSQWRHLPVQVPAGSHPPKGIGITVQRSPYIEGTPDLASKELRVTNHRTRQVPPEGGRSSGGRRRAGNTLPKHQCTSQQVQIHQEGQEVELRSLDVRRCRLDL